MREHREPWLKLPAKDPGSKGRPLLDPRFRTHAVALRRPDPAPAVPSPEPPDRPLPEPKEPRIRLPDPPAGVPTSAAIQRAAAVAAISQPAIIRLGPRPALTMEPPPATRPAVAAQRPPAARPAVAAETSRALPKPVETRAPAAPEVGLDDLPTVSSADWAVRVGEAAKMVDVVVVFYTVAYLGSEMFKVAFRTVVNEVLPQLGRPYTVYRFCLDAEPGFVAEMAESLGLPRDNPVTMAGFTWSGPGRRLFVLGDQALESPPVFHRSLRRSLAGQPAQIRDERAARRLRPPNLMRPRERAGRPWGGRVLAVAAWCLFGSAALGAAVVGIAPKWTSSLLHPTSVSQRGPGASAPTPVASTSGLAIPPAVSPDNTAPSAALAEAPQAQSKPGKPPKNTRRKQTPSGSSLNPTYWGLPSESGTR